MSSRACRSGRPCRTGPTPRRKAPRRGGTLRPASFDNPVGAVTHGGWDIQAERLCRFGVDREVHLTRLLHRKVAGPFAAKQASRIHADDSMRLLDAAGIADEPAGGGEFRRRVDGRNLVAQRERAELAASRKEERVAGDDEAADALA